MIKPKVKKVKETIAEPDVNEKKELTENWKGRDQQRFVIYSVPMDKSTRSY